MKMTSVMLVSISAAILYSSTAAALDTMPTLSLDLAKKMAAGCEAMAQEKNWKMNVSVVDSGANEIFFERMNGAYLGSGDVAKTASICVRSREITGQEIGYRLLRLRAKNGS
jgi:glc operon protein GlcG